MQARDCHNRSMLVRARGLLLSMVLCLCVNHLGMASPQQATYEPCGSQAVVQGAATKTVTLSGPQPGATDPMGIPAGRYQVYPDHGVGLFQPGLGNSLQTLFYQTDGDSLLSLGNSSVIQNQTWNPTPISAVAGRILTPDHDNLVYATRVGDPSQYGPVAISFAQEGPSVMLPDNLLPRQTDSTDFIAIAQADLDKVVDANGNLHNEVVVAHVSGQGATDGANYYKYSIDVLNYSSGNVSSPDITSASFIDFAPIFNTNPQSGLTHVLPVDNIMAMAIGDFAGDGNQEIAIAALGNATILLYTYRYQTVNGAHSLTLVNAAFWNILYNVAPTGDYPVGTLSAVAANLDGKGPDELVVGYSKWGYYPDGNRRTGTFTIGLLIFKYSGTTPALVNSSFRLTAQRPFDLSFAYEFRPRVQLAAGQFLFQPPDIPYGRRQLALAWNDSGLSYGNDLQTPRQLTIVAFQVSSDLSKVSYIGLPYRIRTGYPAPRQVYSLAAGSFQGVYTNAPSAQPPGPPVSSVAISFWLGNTGLPTSAFEVKTFLVDPTNGPVLANTNTLSLPMTVDPTARLPLVAYDLQGKTFYLGGGVHMTVFGAARTDTILEEPPKHLYWDEETRQVVNLTRHDNNNVHLYSGNTSSFSTSSTDEASRNTGGSIAASVGGAVGVGGSWLLGSANASASVDATLRGSYDYDEHKSDYNSGYSTRQISSASSTDHDDFLSGEMQTFDVRRYRVYGVPQQGPTNTYYELVLPGPEEHFANGGLNYDWYQPVHENGNILSHPSALGPAPNFYTPADLGTFTLPDGTQLTEPLVPATVASFDGTGVSSQLSFSTEVTTGKSFTYSHELAESADVKVSYTSSAEFAGFTSEFRACGSVEFHNSNSWGGSSSSNETSKTETAITLNRAAGNPSYAYPFFPVVYLTQDGTLKMESAVPNPGQKSSNSNNYQTYATLYGGKQDPALNLPWRFDSYIITPEQVGWLPNLRTIRKQMRGLFFRKPDVDEVTGTYDFLSLNPAPGDVVRVEARIYNYSTNITAYDIPVQFEAIPYDSGYNSEICANPINAKAGTTAGLVCPSSARTVIGQITIPALSPLQWTCLDGTDDPNITHCASPAYIDWDTTQFGTPYPGTAEYRIYVVLNADGSAGAETYGGEGEPVPITNVASTTPLEVTVPGNQFHLGDFVTIGGVQGLNEANGIFQIGSFSNNGDTFALNTCQPSPPCAAFSSPGRIAYQGGGTATLLDPGQNNEGYGLIEITTPLAQSSGETPVTPTDYLETNSLEGVRTIGSVSGTLAAGWMLAYLYDHQQLRFTAYTNTIHADSAQALLFDGDPAAGAPAIASKTIHPGANGSSGESVWFDWAPTTPGLHKLFAVLFDGTGPQQKVELDVDVTNGNPASQ